MSGFGLLTTPLPLGCRLGEARVGASPYIPTSRLRRCSCWQPLSICRCARVSQWNGCHRVAPPVRAPMATVRETLANGVARSIFALMDLALPVPDHTTLARRRRTVSIDVHAPGRKAPVDLVLDSTGLKFYGPSRRLPGNRLPGSGGVGPQEARRKASRLEEVASGAISANAENALSVDAGTGEILSHALTTSDTSDAAWPASWLPEPGAISGR